MSKPQQRTSKSTATLLNASGAIEFDTLAITAPEGVALTVASQDVNSVHLQGGLKALTLNVTGTSFFQTLGQFNGNVALNDPDFLMYLGPQAQANTWRLRIHAGFLIFEKYDSVAQDYVSRFHLY
jgi:hypothetical protein